MITFFATCFTIPFSTPVGRQSRNTQIPFSTPVGRQSRNTQIPFSTPVGRQSRNTQIFNSISDGVVHTVDSVYIGIGGFFAA